MPTYSRILLSGSTNGKPISVTDTSTPGTLIHTAAAGSTAFDEVYLWVSNLSGSAVALTLEWGGATDAELLVKALSIPANSDPIPVAVGQTLNGALEVRAFAATTAVLNITGYANRIS